MGYRAVGYGIWDMGYGIWDMGWAGEIRFAVTCGEFHWLKAMGYGRLEERRLRREEAGR